VTPLSGRNPRIQQLRRLSGRRSARQETGRFVIEGPRLVADAVAAGLGVDEVFVAAGGRELAEPVAAAGVPVTEVALGVLERIATTVSPQPLVAVARSPLVTVAELPPGGAVVVLVDVNDPGNAGTVMRSAEAAGAAGVVLLGDAVDALNPKVVRAAAGSLFRLPVAVETDPAAGVEALRGAGRRLVGAAARGGSRPDTDVLAPPVAIVLGSESHGLAPALAAVLDATVSIPMAGDVESLNLAMAATLLVFAAAAGRH
jgi:TrmH family RNA methyltransferase